MESGRAQDLNLNRNTKRPKHDEVIASSMKTVETELELLAMDSEPTLLTQFTRMDELPIECISHIFTFFSFEELNVLSSICKKWQRYCWTFQEELRLSIPRRQKLRDAQIIHLSKCIELKSLNLHGSKHLTDEGVKIISRLPKLLKLNLSFCSGITDQAIKHLQGLPNIRILLLSYCCQLTSKSLEYLSVLKTLKELDLSGCGQIGDEGLFHLLEFPELVKLDLSFNKITKEGMDVILPGIPNEVQLKYTTVASQAFAASPNHQMMQASQTKQGGGMYYPGHDPRYQDIDSDEDSGI